MKRAAAEAKAAEDARLAAEAEATMRREAEERAAAEAAEAAAEAQAKEKREAEERELQRKQRLQKTPGLLIGKGCGSKGCRSNGRSRS